MDSQRKWWEQWEEGTPWQRFANRWRNVEDFDLEHLFGAPLSDLALPGLGGNSLMIRTCYVEKLVRNRALNLPDTGVIITGQPGIGMIISCVSVRLC